MPRSRTRPRLPLTTQVILGLLLNLSVVCGVFAAVFILQVRLNPGWLLAGRTGDRLRSVTELMSGDLFQARTEGRVDAEAEILERYREVYDLDFLLFDPRGASLAPTTNAIPPEVLQEVTRPRGESLPRNRQPGLRRLDPAPPPNPAPPSGAGVEPGRESSARPGRGYGAGPGPRFRGPGRTGQRMEPVPPSVLRAGSPPAYWIVMPIPPHGPGPGLMLVLRAPSLWTGGLLFDPRPWLLAGTGALALSILFWLPIVRGITRDVGRMTRQTEEIAAGRFETRLDLRRGDELGRLAEAIDQMAGRLARHVDGQKRFLGDAAHELSTPVARMQTAVAILEARPGQDNTSYLNDLREELDEMAGLINELLAFSRALHGRPVRLQPVALRPLVDRAWAREAGENATFRNDVGPDLEVEADPALLQRAVANLLRNALRYAAAAGPITATARTDGSRVILAIEDVGPGVPPEALPRLFEPFFRPEDSRARELGGAGLGLAIVRTCIDACQGTVSANNLSPCGFSVSLRLNAPPVPTPTNR
jgi:two-component system sensor histidine kinase CpxA